MKKEWGKAIMIGVLCAFFAGNSLSVRAEEYEYDALNRVTKVLYEDGSYILYEYDNNGNLLRAVIEEAEKPKDNINREEEDKESGTGGSESGTSSSDAADSQGSDIQKPESGNPENEKPESGNPENEKPESGNPGNEKPESGKSKAEKIQDENEVSENPTQSEGQEQKNTKENQKKEMKLPWMLERIIKVIGVFLLLMIKLQKWLNVF